MKLDRRIAIYRAVRLRGWLAYRRYAAALEAAGEGGGGSRPGAPDRVRLASEAD